MAEHIAKIPPHANDAEQSVLGSILIDNEAMIKIGDLLKPEDFYASAHQSIYEHMYRLYHSNKPIDYLTLCQALEDNNKLEAVGDRAYITELTLAVPTSHNAFEYAMIVKNKAVFRRLIHTGQEITSLGYKEGEDLNQSLSEAEKSLFSVTQTFIKNRFTHIKDILKDRYDEFATLHDMDEADMVRGVSTGFNNLDKILSGLNPSDLIILAGRPAMGKTAFALNMVQNIALKAGKSVGLFSLEMSKEQLVDRMFSAVMGVDGQKLKTGQLEDHDFAEMGKAMERLSQAKIFIDDTADTTLSELKSKARRLQMEHGLDLIVIDYLQLMHGNNPNNRVQEISEISRGLKGLARELHVPVISLSQLSRAVESRPVKIPLLSDLRESGSIEQDADAVLMIYREDYYEEDTDRAGLVDIFVRKHRHGPTGRATLKFNKAQSHFVEVDDIHQEMGMD